MAVTLPSVFVEPITTTSLPTLRSVCAALTVFSYVVVPENKTIFVLPSASLTVIELASIERMLPDTAPPRAPATPVLVPVNLCAPLAPAKTTQRIS